MSKEIVKAQKIPSYVHFVNLIMNSLLRVGIPTSPTVLLTVNGRKSGKRRSTPVVMFELDGRNYIASFFGESNWVRNLRAAGKAVVRRGLRRKEISGVELDPAEAAAILQNSLTPYFKNRLMGRLIRTSFHVTPNSSNEEWSEAARSHPVFEVLESVGA